MSKIYGGRTVWIEVSFAISGKIQDIAPSIWAHTWKRNAKDIKTKTATHDM